MEKKTGKLPTGEKLALGIIVLAIAFLVVMLFVVKPGDTRGRRRPQPAEGIPANATGIEVNSETAVESEKPVAAEPAPTEKVESEAASQPAPRRRAQDPEPSEPEQEDHLLDIRGYMTLNEVAARYDVPADYLKKKLGIPADVSGNLNLGQLRKRYRGFRMSDVEAIILKYRKQRP